MGRDDRGDPETIRRFGAAGGSPGGVKAIPARRDQSAALVFFTGTRFSRRDEILWLYPDWRQPMVRPPHILVIDDDPLVCKTIQMILEGEGCSVTCAVDGQKGLAAFRNS